MWRGHDLCALERIACAYLAGNMELSERLHRESTSKIFCIWIRRNLNRLCNIDLKHSNERVTTSRFSLLSRYVFFEYYEYRVFIFVFHQFSKLSGVGDPCPKRSLNMTFYFIYTHTSTAHIALRSHLIFIFLVFFYYSLWFVSPYDMSNAHLCIFSLALSTTKTMPPHTLSLFNLL